MKFCFYILILYSTLISCGENFDSKHIVESLKKSELRIRDVVVERNGLTDSISIDENTFIFDTTYSRSKCKFLAYFYPEKQNIFFKLKNRKEEFYNYYLNVKQVDSIKEFYTQNLKFLKLQQFVFKEYLAEEQWNTKTALRTLKSEYNEFNSYDYFDYIYNASMGDKKSCIKLKLLYILIREVKLENFWQENGPRNDAFEFIEKSNEIFNLLKHPIVSPEDDFKTILNSIRK